MNKITRKKYLSTSQKGFNYIFESRKLRQVLYMGYITYDNLLRRKVKESN